MPHNPVACAAVAMEKEPVRDANQSWRKITLLFHLGRKSRFKLKKHIFLTLFMFYLLAPYLKELRFLCTQACISNRFNHQIRFSFSVQALAHPLSRSFKTPSMLQVAPTNSWPKLSMQEIHDRNFCIPKCPKSFQILLFPFQTSAILLFSRLLYINSNVIS